MADRHAVLATVRLHGRDLDLYVFEGTWDAAQAVWKHLDDRARDPENPLRASQPVELRFFSVRSTDDPRSKLAHRNSPAFYRADSDRAKAETLRVLDRAAYQAFRAYRRKTLGQIALAAVNDEELPTLSKVIQRVVERATEAGLTLERWEAQDAIKARIIIGRTAGRGNARRDGVAYFAPKRAGRLYDLRTSDGERLYQTTLALQAPFYRLKQEA